MREGVEREELLLQGARACGGLGDRNGRSTTERLAQSGAPVFMPAASALSAEYIPTAL